MAEVKVRTNGGKLPQYMSDHASGADVFASNGEPIKMEPGKTALVPTGLFVEIPEGFEIQVRPRSGLAFKHGITILNAPGTIDSDYRGEVKILLINHGPEAYTINKGERVAQLVLHKTEKAEFVEAAELKETGRGEGGFGSTGKH